MPIYIQPDLIRNGLGAVRQPRKLQPRKDGSLDPQTITDQHADMKALASAINGNLSLGDGSQGSIMGNLNGQVFWLDLTGVAGVVFTLRHALGRIPIGFFPFHVTAPGNIKAEVVSHNRESWTSDVAEVATINASTGTVYFFLF